MKHTRDNRQTRFFQRASWKHLVIPLLIISGILTVYIFVGLTQRIRNAQEASPKIHHEKR